jgi:hypothetical protein
MTHLLERVAGLIAALLLARGRGSLTSWFSQCGYRWAILACLLLVWQARPLVRHLRPGPTEIRDFYQEWASARNHANGLPVYTEQERTVPLYLGFRRDPHDVYFVEVNAHPPPSVLLAFPLAGFDYRAAHLAWNLLSLAALGFSGWLIARALGVPRSPRLVLMAVFVLIGDPLHQQVVQGQLNCLLLLMITGIWRADRSERPVLAGVLLGLATGIKLLPGVLFLYFLARRQWRVMLAGLACFTILMAATASILGLDTFSSYLTDVLPRIAEWRSLHYNNSIPGWWHKLFDPGSKGYPIIGLSLWPALARCGAALSCATVVLLSMWAAARAKVRRDWDQAFGAAVIAMLLVSPVAWEHYSVVLVLPVALLANRLPSSSKARGLLGVILVVLSIQPEYLWSACGLRGWMVTPMSPWNTVTALSIQLYAILGLFALGLTTTRAKVTECGLGLHEDNRAGVVPGERAFEPVSTAA